MIPPTAETVALYRLPAMLSLSPASRRAVVCLAEAFALLPFQLAPLETAALQLQAAGMPVSPRTILQALQAAAVAA